MPWTKPNASPRLRLSLPQDGCPNLGIKSNAPLLRTQPPGMPGSRCPDGSFLIPKCPVKGTRFLYYFCLCNPFKELFLYDALRGYFLVKRVQRYCFFLIPPNFLNTFFIIILALFAILDSNQIGFYSYIIIYYI